MCNVSVAAVLMYDGASCRSRSRSLGRGDDEDALTPTVVHDDEEFARQLQHWDFRDGQSGEDHVGDDKDQTVKVEATSMGGPLTVHTPVKMEANDISTTSVDWPLTVHTPVKMQANGIGAASVGGPLTDHAFAVKLEAHWCKFNNSLGKNL